MKPRPPGGFTRRRLTVLVFTAFLAVQILVPLRLLPKPANKPFGWQMYSAISYNHFHVGFADGSTRPIDPREFVVRYRSEVDYRLYLPAVLCSRFPEAIEVVATSAVAQSTQRYPCDR